MNADKTPILICVHLRSSAANFGFAFIGGFKFLPAEVARNWLILKADGRNWVRFVVSRFLPNASLLISEIGFV